MDQLFDGIGKPRELTDAAPDLSCQLVDAAGRTGVRREGHVDVGIAGPSLSFDINGDG